MAQLQEIRQQELLPGPVADIENRRILIVDDNKAIHEDFAKILPFEPEELDTFDDMEQDLFSHFSKKGYDRPMPDPAYYELTHAYQGEDAYKMVSDAEGSGNPFAVVFMDVRMPPGWDGIETIKRIWKQWPHMEMVICTAYSDYSWEKILQKVGSTDQLMFLRKPFDVISVKQMALALTKKWNLGLKVRRQVEDLEIAVANRTRELEQKRALVEQKRELLEVKRVELEQKVTELEKANEEIQTLQGIIPMCMYCNKIRDDENFWQQVDHYIQGKTFANVSHSVCPQCYDSAMSSMLKEIKEDK